MWPLIAPGAAIAFALVFVMNFGVFPSAVLVGQPAGQTRTIAIAAYQQAFEHSDMSMASAIAVVMGLCQLLGLAIVVGLAAVSPPPASPPSAPASDDAVLAGGGWRSSSSSWASR